MTLCMFFVETELVVSAKTANPAAQPSLKALVACRVGEGPGDEAVERMGDARSTCQQQMLPCSSHVVSCLVTCSVTDPAAAERRLLTWHGGKGRHDPIQHQYQHKCCLHPQ